MAPIFSKLCSCLKPVNQPAKETSSETTNTPDQQHEISAPTEPLEPNLGHSFRYVRSSTHSDRFLYTPSSSLRFSPSRSDHPETGFKAISGASVSANNSNPKTVLQMRDMENENNNENITHEGGKGIKIVDGFKSTSSFRALSLHHAPARRESLFLSGPLTANVAGAGAGENGGAGDAPFSAPLGEIDPKEKPKTAFSRFRDACQRVISERKNFPALNFTAKKEAPATGDVKMMEKGESSVQWAHGRAGEDRAHVVVPEEQGWMFVGIYDGFNGPDAPEYLKNNLYNAIYNELKGLFYEVEDNAEEINTTMESEINHDLFQSLHGNRSRRRSLWDYLEEEDDRQRSLDISGSKGFALSMHEAISKLKHIGLSLKRKKSQKEKADAGKEGTSGGEGSKKKVGPIDHGSVLRAMSKALEETEAGYLEMTERLLESNAELALMGSCVLVVIMRDEDVYVMNVGDSRAVVAQSKPTIDNNEESLLDGDEGEIKVEIEEQMSLVALQLSTDHSTSIVEVYAQF